jgi:oligoendopeptidase F
VVQNNGQYQQTRWTLSAIFPEPDHLEVTRTMEKLEKVTAEIETLRPTLSSEMSGEDFLRILGLVERFTELAHRLGSYGQLWFSEDTQNQKALAFMGQMEQLLTDNFNRILFFNLPYQKLKRRS